MDTSCCTCAWCVHSACATLEGMHTCTWLYRREGRCHRARGLTAWWSCGHALKPYQPAIPMWWRCTCMWGYACGYVPGHRAVAGSTHLDFTARLLAATWRMTSHGQQQTPASWSGGIRQSKLGELTVDRQHHSTHPPQPPVMVTNARRKPCVTTPAPAVSCPTCGRSTHTHTHTYQKTCTRPVIVGP